MKYYFSRLRKIEDMLGYNSIVKLPINLIIDSDKPIPEDEISQIIEANNYSDKVFIIPCFKEEDDVSSNKSVVVFCNKRGIYD